MQDVESWQELVREATHLFMRHDQDNSDSIDVGELRGCLRGLGLDPTTMQVGEVLDRYDADGNRTLDKREFLALVRDADDNALPQDYAAVAPKAEGSLHAGALRCTEHEAVCAAHADAKWLVYAYSSAEGKKPPPTTAASAAAALRDATETVPDRAVRDLGPAQIDSIMSQAADEGASRHPRDLPSLGTNSRALASHAFLALAQAKSFFSPSQRRPSRRSCSSRSA